MLKLTLSCFPYPAPFAAPNEWIATVLLTYADSTGMMHEEAHNVKGESRLEVYTDAMLWVVDKVAK